ADRQSQRCRHVPDFRLPHDAWACSRWEAPAEVDCLTCGACCREAYHSVEVSEREPVNKLHPDMVVVMDTHRKLRREGDRCAALTGGNTPHEAYACAIYEDRPRTCREFTLGSENCLDARRRVGLSL
ncbi:MAG: YkgJ family cysteine cluster protein, partial [Candidatus Methylumidiphilus sp.]